MTVENIITIISVIAAISGIITAVESSAKQAHHRIDRLEGNNHEN